MVARQPTVRPPRLLSWTLSLLLHAGLFASMAYLLPLTLRNEPGALPAVPMDLVMDQGEEESKEQAESMEVQDVPIGESIYDPKPVEFPDLPQETAVPDTISQVASQNAESPQGAVQGALQVQGGQARLSLFGNEARGRKFVFVFDRSISMEGAPLRAAKSQLWGGIGALGNEHEFQVVFFNHEPKVWEGSQVERQLLSATEENKALASQFVDDIRARGGTYRRSALLLALQLKPDVVYFLTDADAPMGGSDVLEAVRLARGNNTAIHAIEFGIFPRPSRENFLKQLARYTGGEYVYVAMEEL